MPEGPLELEEVSRTGEVTRRFSLTASESATLLAEAADAASAAGLGWNEELVTLRPAPKLAELIRLSRAGKAEEA